MADQETRYTLEEAARVLARRECEREGHDLEQTVVRNAGGSTVTIAIYCPRCGAGFTETGGPWT